MRLKLSVLLLSIVALAAVVLLVASGRMQAQEEAKKDKKPADRYALPEGGVKELVKFLEELKAFEPDNAEQFFEFRQKGPAAMQAAAEKILKLETDKTSPAYQTAYELVLVFRFQEIEKLNVEQKSGLVDELKKHLTGRELSDTDVQLAMSAAQMLEYSAEEKLAAELYGMLGKLVADSKKERYAELIPICEGSARRLSLVGQPIKVQGPALDGKKFDIASLKGKVVLIDFWATWCGPCREEFPNVRTQYDKYKEKGFEVVGISIDEDRQALEDYVAEVKVPWITLHDQAESGDTIAGYYGVNSIPQMILVGRDGKVISLQARGEELNRLLAEQFAADAKDSAKEKN